MNKTIDAVRLKRELQKKAEKKIAKLSPKQQIELLQKKFGSQKRLTAA